MVGKDAPFVIHPGEFVLGRTLEWVELPDDIVARIEGKALALDTPIPTPTGWKLMDQFQIGDLVFDEAGRPTAVIDATEVMTGRECRQVVFSDGTSMRLRPRPPVGGADEVRPQARGSARADHP